MGLFSFPFFISGFLGKYIDILFGLYTGYLAFFPLQYILYRSYSKIYNKNTSMKNISKLILSMRLINKTSMEIEYYDLFKAHVNKIKKK